MAYKGKFTPTNPGKYRGNISNITYRSLWELKVMKYLDIHPQVLWWASEELAIPYVSPIDDKVHRYYPDFVFKHKNKNGTENVEVWEIKPFNQTIVPRKRRKTKKYLAEMATYAVNQEKWKAAELFCMQHGIRFSIITENDLEF